MEKDSIGSLIEHLPLDDLEKEIAKLVSEGKPEAEIIEILIKRFDR